MIYTPPKTTKFEIIDSITQATNQVTRLAFVLFIEANSLSIFFCKMDICMLFTGWKVRTETE